MRKIYRLLWWDDCPFGGTNPNPDAPTITPLDSTGPSAGGSGNTTGPEKIYKYFVSVQKNLYKYLEKLFMIVYMEYIKKPDTYITYR